VIEIDMKIAPLHPALRTQCGWWDQLLLAIEHRRDLLVKREIVSSDVEGLMTPGVEAGFEHVIKE
jgi:hypothetical protein